MQGIYKLMKFRYLFWLYWKIQQAARYKSLNPHWETDRGTEITLSETSSHTIFFFFFPLPLLISKFATCSRSPYPQWSRMHFHGNFGWAVFSGSLGLWVRLNVAMVQMVVLGPSTCLLAQIGRQSPSRGFIMDVRYKYMNREAQLMCTHKHYTDSFTRTQTKHKSHILLYQLVWLQEQSPLRKHTQSQKDVSKH